MTHRRLDLTEMHDIVTGAAILGSGGGGSLRAARRVLDETPAIQEGVGLRAVESLSDESLVGVITELGSPVAWNEGTRGGAGNKAVRLLQQTAGVRLDALVPLHTGAVTYAVAMAAAAETGLPLVDGDGAGRAVPWWHLSSFHVAGVGGACAVCNAGPNGVVVFAEDTYDSERLARAVLPRLGMTATAVRFPLNGTQAESCTLPGLISRAETVGRSLRQNSDAAGRVAAAVASISGRILLEGVATCADLEITEDGHDRGSIRIEGTGEDRGRSATIRFLDCSVLVSDDSGRNCGLAPDLIGMVSRNGIPLTCADVSEGQHLIVIVGPGHPRWASDSGADIFVDLRLQLARSSIPASGRQSNRMGPGASVQS